MVYALPSTIPATPELPLEANPATGHDTDLPCPTLVLHVVLTALRYPVKTKVVPELSERWTGIMSLSGRVVVGLRAWIAASFHFVIVPRYMFAMTSPVKCRPVGIPGRLYAMVTAPIVSGICSALGRFVASVALKGASEPAKSTVFSVNALIPPPLPDGLVVYLCPGSGCCVVGDHCADEWVWEGCSCSGE